MNCGPKRKIVMAFVFEPFTHATPTLKRSSHGRASMVFTSLKKPARHAVMFGRSNRSIVLSLARRPGSRVYAGSSRYTAPEWEFSNSIPSVVCLSSILYSTGRGMRYSHSRKSIPFRPIHYTQKASLQSVARPAHDLLCKASLNARVAGGGNKKTRRNAVSTCNVARLKRDWINPRHAEDMMKGSKKEITL